MVRNFTKKHKTLGKIFLILIVLISAAVILLSSVYIDISGRMPALMEKIRPNLYGEMKITSASIKFLPTPMINLSGFSLTNSEGDLISSAEVKLKVKLIPLFFKKYRVDMLAFKNADILFWRYADGTINFTKIVKVKKLDIKINALSLRGGNLRLVDDLPASGGIAFECASLNFDMRRSQEGTFKFDLKGMGDNGHQITLSGKTSRSKAESAKLSDSAMASPAAGGDKESKLTTTVSGRVKAEGFDLTLIAPYLQEKHPEINIKGIVRLDGDYSIGNGISYAGKVSYKDLLAPVPWLKNPEIESASGSGTVDIKFGSLDKRFLVKDAKLTVGELKITGRVDYGGLVEKIPSFTLKLSSSRDGYDKVTELIPIRIMPGKMAARIEAFKVTDGELEIKEFFMSVPLNELRNSDRLLRDRESFRMELAFTDTDFTYPGFDKKFTDISGSIRLGGRDLSLDGFTGSYGTAKIDDLHGELLGMGRKASYDIWLNGSFTAEETLEELKKNVKSLRKIEARGQILANVEIKGKKGSSIGASGELTLKGNSIKHDIVPLHFSEASGKVAFAPDKVSFSKLKALHGASSVTLEGEIAFKGKNKTPELNLRTSGEITENSLVVLLRKKGVKAALPSYEGTARFDILFKGHPGALNVDSSVDFKDTNLSYLNLIKKRQGFPVSYKSKTLYRKDALEVNFLELNFGSSSIRLRGSSSRDFREYKLAISPTTLKIADLDDISPYLIPDEDAGGYIALSMKFDRRRSEDGTRINGWLSVKDGAVKTIFLKDGLKNILLNAEFNGKEGKLTVENFKTGNTTLSAKVDMLDIPARKINFEIRSPQAVISDLIPVWKKGSLSRSKHQPNGTGEIIIKKGNVFGHPITDLRSNVNFNKDYINLNNISFASNGGVVTGDLSYIKNPAEEFLYKANLDIKDVDLDKMLLSLGVHEEKKTLTGSLNSEVNLTVKRGSSFARAMNGEMTLNIKDGKLWKGVVISKIFSIINIISINALFEKGLPYNSISGSFKVTDGLVSSEDITFESSSLRMSAVGKINAEEKTIQGTLGFHPFVTVDKIITSIPLAGWIMGGKEKSLISMYYEVTGPLKNPDVYPVPVKTIGKGILGILQRALETPVKILTPEKNGDDGAKATKNNITKKPAEKNAEVKPEEDKP